MRISNRSPAFARPCPLEVGNQKEAALIQEDQVGSKPIGLFLYWARRVVSSNESRPHAAPWLACWASGNSSPIRSLISRDWQCNNAPESVFGLSRQCVLTSSNLSDNRRRAALSPKCGSTSFSAVQTKAPVGHDADAVSSLSCLVSDRPVANAPRSLKKRLLLELQSGTNGLVLRDERLKAAVFLTFAVSLGVS